MKNLLKVFLMCFITLFAFAGQMMGQQKTITGRVVDALNEGMPGVNVQVKGTTSGTITNIDGDFSISVPNTKSVLVFFYWICEAGSCCGKPNKTEHSNER